MFPDRHGAGRACVNMILRIECKPIRTLSVKRPASPGDTHCRRGLCVIAGVGRSECCLEKPSSAPQTRNVRKQFVGTYELSRFG